MSVWNTCLALKWVFGMGPCPVGTRPLLLYAPGNPGTTCLSPLDLRLKALSESFRPEPDLALSWEPSVSFVPRTALLFEDSSEQTLGPGPVSQSSCESCGPRPLAVAPCHAELLTLIGTRCCDAAPICSN